MDRKIVIEVNGSYIRKDSDVAGVQGEANSTVLNIIFDQSWSGYAKKITFWDSRGENPVERTLTTDLLTDITKSTLDYSVPIPGEPLMYQGTMTFVIDGFVDGARKRSASDKLKVKYSPIADTAEEPADPTPTQAEQLQKQIDTMLGDMQSERVQAQEAKNEAVNAAEEATASAEKASTAEFNTSNYASVAVEAAKNANLAKADAQTSSQKAYQSEKNAKASEEKALDAAERAEAASEHPPMVNPDTKTWWCWYEGQYIDTGVPATILVDINTGQEVKMWFGTIDQYNALDFIYSDVSYNILEGEVEVDAV